MSSEKEDKPGFRPTKILPFIFGCHIPGRSCLTWREIEALRKAGKLKPQTFYSLNDPESLEIFIKPEE